ncbi:signal recognition particle subunit SRP19/SEC65 family protein [Candidatus Nitrosotenuis aquarius]|uniref:signal recognition particle subunit SRP19/SEC65 family protein n=1 Tax=Candidatus Nitrosotenuis aquarius TaxID=1846278 RepID=UPI000C1E4C89|nr:signal recognition particle subunit SRP19/SEC65 family protein [Candidatus Nitrosotenuis aquarius]
MKDYEHVVIWLDYFNKNLTIRAGRRLPKEKCIFDPSLKELQDAATDAGLVLKESNEKARFPRRAFVRSGYIVVPKTTPKGKILAKISEKMVSKRAKQSK